MASTKNAPARRKQQWPKGTMPRVAVCKMIGSRAMLAWEILGLAPPQHRLEGLGNRAVYPRAEVEEWMADRRRESHPACTPTRRFTEARHAALDDLFGGEV